jgi:hypothetical protein
MSRAVEPVRIRLRKLGPDVLEVKIAGYLGETDAGYLHDVAALAQQSGKVFILYDLSEFTGFHKSQVMAHAHAVAGMASNLHAIAVTYATASVRFAIVTVALFSRVDAKGFATRREGEAWIESLRGSSISRTM